MVFETQRLIVRVLVLGGLLPFHEMQSNPKVMQYADGEVKRIEEHKNELKELIEKYKKGHNNFWIYAIERKQDSAFLGTIALVKDGKDDEIGYRFLERYWGKGYSFEVCKRLVVYARQLHLKKLDFKMVEKSNKCK